MSRQAGRDEVEGRMEGGRQAGKQVVEFLCLPLLAPLVITDIVGSFAPAQQTPRPNAIGKRT